MKKVLLYTLFWAVFSIPALSQEKHYFGIDIGLTQTYKGFFYLYDGVLDVGISYNKNLVKGLYGGGSFHINYLSRGNSSARTIVYKPKVNLGYQFQVTSWLSIHPIGFIGYSFMTISNKEFDYAETQCGINSGAELRLEWNNNAQVETYVFGRYDFIYLNNDEHFTRLEYYRKVHLTNVGIGIKIKPKKEQSPGSND